MVQQQTLLKVIDNSGAALAKCIKILGGLKKKYAFIGDYITVSIKQLKNKSKKISKVKKKEIYKALIIKTKTKNFKKTGYAKMFTYNAIILLNKQKTPVATRILTYVPTNLKKKNYKKLLRCQWA